MSADQTPLPLTAQNRLNALVDLQVPDDLKDMLHLAIHQSIKPVHQRGYTYADDVEVSGGLRPPDPLAACTRPTYIGLECVHGNSSGRVVRCRKCEACQHQWRGKVRRLILDGCQGRTAYMWTLTIHEYPFQMKEDRYDFAQKAWAKLRRKAQRRQIEMRYLRVVELQQRGTPHFHLAITDWKRRGILVTRTDHIFQQAMSLALASGFGPQMDLSRARLGPAGVASYMSKYLQKGNNYLEMQREDGRAIRRYNRGRGWDMPIDPPSWRFRAVPNSYTHTELLETDLNCACGKNELLPHRSHASAWIRRCHTDGSWLAPLSILDYIIKENLSWDAMSATLVPAQ